MQIIYDSTGAIYMQGTGFTEPIGELNFLNVSTPHGSYVEKIDTSKNPPEPVIKEYPKSDMELMKGQLEQQQADLDYLKLISEDE